LFSPFHRAHGRAAVGQSRFYIGAAIMVGSVASLARSEALESPDRP